VVFYEPNVPHAEVQGAKAADSLEDALKGAQAAILLVDHRPFRGLDPAQVAEWMDGDLIFDTRGIWAQDVWRQASLDLQNLGVG
jgi:UDP-N-acetyl-D-mannosaminuronate dehydrogenase